jgi:two-component system response regulator YesN
MRVLIVDDENHVLEGLKKTIDWAKLDVEDLDFANNGEMAWEKFQHSAPDILITDMNMPKMNGVELIKQIRKVDTELPIIILSGYDDFSYTREAIHHNVTRYLLKPTVPQEIERELQEVLEEMKQTRLQKKLFTQVREQLDSNMPLLREQFLHHMITTGLNHNELDAGKLSFYQLDPEITRSATVMFVKLYKTDRRNQITEYEWQLFKFAASNIIEEIITTHGKGKGYVIHYIDRGLPVLLYGSENELLLKTKEIAQEIIHSISMYLSLDVNVGIGQIVQQTIKYPLSYKEAVEALEYCELEGLNQYLYIRDIKSLVSEWPKYPVDKIRLLTEALVRMDPEEVTSRWLDIEQTLNKVQNIPLSFIQTMCISILSNLLLQIMESEYLLIDSDKMTAMLRNIHQHESTKALIQSMQTEIFYLLGLLKDNAAQQQQTPYVNYVKKVVEGNFDQKISFAQLAKELNISRNYLSNIFKRETGVSFMTYLTDFRISKAKDLLLRREYMVYEIAEKVGYRDPAYFSRMFKAETGMSPFEYMMNEE